MDAVCLFSIRLLPHHQDTGAFFVALFEKFDTNAAAAASEPATAVEESTCQKRPAEDVPFNEEGYCIHSALHSLSVDSHRCRANFKRARYHRENPFIFFEEKDIKGFWQEIR